jgi:hypothetical protein
MHFEFHLICGVKLGLEHSDELVGIGEDGDGFICPGIILDLLVFRLVIAFTEGEV